MNVSIVNYVDLMKNMKTCKYCGQAHVGTFSIPSCVDVKIATLEKRLGELAVIEMERDLLKQSGDSLKAQLQQVTKEMNTTIVEQTFENVRQKAVINKLKQEREEMVRDAKQMVDSLKYSGMQHSNALHGPDSGYEASCPICKALSTPLAKRLIDERKEK